MAKADAAKNLAKWPRKVFLISTFTQVRLVVLVVAVDLG